MNYSYHYRTECFLQILLKELSSLTQESSKTVPPNISYTNGEKKKIYRVINGYKSSLEPSQKHAKCASKCKQVLLIFSCLFITSGIHLSTILLQTIVRNARMNSLFILLLSCSPSFSFPIFALPSLFGEPALCHTLPSSMTHKTISRTISQAG